MRKEILPDEQSLMEYIGGRIRDLRVSYGGSKGLTQGELAKELGINFHTISHWENVTYRPSIGDIERLARFFGVSILTFFPAEEAPSDGQLIKLLSIAKRLSPEDVEELIKYANFRAQH